MKTIKKVMTHARIAYMDRRYGDMQFCKAHPRAWIERLILTSKQLWRDTPQAMRLARIKPRWEFDTYQVLAVGEMVSIVFVAHGGHLTVLNIFHSPISGDHVVEANGYRDFLTEDGSAQDGCEHSLDYEVFKQVARGLEMAEKLLTREKMTASN